MYIYIGIMNIFGKFLDKLEMDYNICSNWFKIPNHLRSFSIFHKKLFFLNIFRLDLIY